MEKAPTKAFYWLKAPAGAFIFKTLLLRHSQLFVLLGYFDWVYCHLTGIGSVHNCRAYILSLNVPLVCVHILASSVALAGKISQKMYKRPPPALFGKTTGSHPKVPLNNPLYRVFAKGRIEVGPPKFFGLFLMFWAFFDH